MDNNMRTSLNRIEVGNSGETLQGKERGNRKMEWLTGEQLSLLDVPEGISCKEWRNKLLEIRDLPGVKVCTYPRMLTKDEFISIFPAGSLTGDGGLLGENFDESGHANFDHHQSDDRRSELAMCEQVSHHFWEENFRAEYHDPVLFVKEGFDGDNTMAIAIAALAQQHPDESDPAVKRLKHLAWLEGRMDAMSGLFPLDSEDAITLKAWVNPINEARQKYGWLLDRATPQEKLQLLETMVRQTQAYAHGQLDTSGVTLEDDYEATEQNGWWFVHEYGPDARQRIARDLHLDPIITYRGSYQGKKHLYSAANFKELAKPKKRVPLPELFLTLNALEGLDKKYHDLSVSEQMELIRGRPMKMSPWGGDPVGGSYDGGSRFSPEIFPALTNKVLSEISQQAVKKGLQGGVQQRKRRISTLISSR